MCLFSQCVTYIHVLYMTPTSWHDQYVAAHIYVVEGMAKHIAKREGDWKLFGRGYLELPLNYPTFPLFRGGQVVGRRLLV